MSQFSVTKIDMCVIPYCYFSIWDGFTEYCLETEKKTKKSIINIKQIRRMKTPTILSCCSFFYDYFIYVNVYLFIVYMYLYDCVTHTRMCGCAHQWILNPEKDVRFTREGTKVTVRKLGSSLGYWDLNFRIIII